MTSLSDQYVQTTFVARCRELWKNWGRYSQERRRSKLKTAINATLRTCNLPEVDLIVGEPFLVAGSWNIRYPNSYLTDQISVDKFARGVTTLYHEGRHSEQWYRIAQGISAGKFRVPTTSLMPQQATVANISNNCAIAFTTAQHAYNNRQHYPQAMDRIISQWYRSIYGYQRAHRGQVLEHLDWSAFFNTHADINFARYLNLPEEKDAYLVQDEVLARLSNHLNMWA